MFAAGLRDALGFGHVYAAMRGVEGATIDELAGVAVWLPPGAFLLSATRQLRALPGMAGVLAAAPRARRVGSSGTRRAWLGYIRPSRTGTWRW
jgi:hypothetical protein